MRDVSLSAQKFDDFSEERAAPKRRASAPGPARAPRKKEPERGVAGKTRRLGLMTMIGIGGLALVGVPLNALYFQDGRHPAPLFSAHFLVPEKPAPVEPPTPPARPAKMESAHADAEPVKAEAAAATKAKARTDTAKGDPLADILKSESAPPAKAEKTEKVERVEKVEKKRETASRDQIGALLGGPAKSSAAAARPAAAPAAPAAPAAATAATAAAADRNVLTAQRALQRLGYVVKPDGLMSPGLKKTIERFERDNGLPVTGELNAKVVKAIATRAAAPHQ